MFGRRNDKRFDEAMSSCKLVEGRLRCINRELERSPDEGLTPGIRRQVRKALQHHLIKCENKSEDEVCEPMPLFQPSGT